MIKHCSSVKDVIKKYGLAVSFLCICSSIQAQENPLERSLTLTIDQVKVEDALFLISQTGGFNFCYNSKLISTDSLVNVHAKGGSVETILKELLGSEMRFINVGNHVVIRRKPPEIESTMGSVTISGFVVDDRSGNQISGVTVFEDFQRRTYKADEQGKFSFTLPKTIRSVALNLSRPGYRDTSIVVLPKENARIIIGLSLLSVSEPIETRIPEEVSVNQAKDPGSDEFISQPQNEMAQFNRNKLVPIQFSLVPMVGTNGLNKIGTDNYLSVNIVAGLTKGLNGLEVGVLLNATRRQMYGIQVSGAANITGTDAMGVQSAMVFNYVGERFFGLQVGGVGNHVRGDFTGAQFSMGYNLSLSNFEGWQMTGGANYVSKNFKGVQMAAGANIVTG
ncbi:MAG: STN domain-containing protein, partial [Flavobacteriales bacterium]|nr:STN domain-containing protein [Flavobacteriales bacterium]